ncbi:DUF6416 domain-containing protein [Actinomadura sp. 7K534]|uniref:DUF6416 domain-containing protein n=1 Tax=Actinomadura sp. 7K534 TaxID=2530366 RepID=UPI00104DE7C8|nr:DUF6416 domain-containing protein [Actinomadura sp. 7K534]TDB89215.1 hypothetical protein E1266_30010 [Actinomadura sp. 7K534]
MYLTDDDRRWDEHSGGSGHDDPEWSHGDEDKALTYWRTLDDNGRAVLRHLFDRRGQQVHCTELVTELGLDPEGKKNPPNVVAGALNQAGQANRATGRRYPFRWWAGEGGADYGVKPGTAAIFERALSADHVKRNPGQVLAFAVPGNEVRKFIEHLGDALAGTDVRMALGSACTTAVKAVQHLVAALQLPYDAAEGWREFFDHLGEGTSLRRCVVVTDACQMLEYEDPDVWHEFVTSLHGGPHCLGGGSSTLVLLDDPFAWEDWRFAPTTEIRPFPPAGHPATG